MVEKEHGMMFVLSSPSGAGKTTLTKKLAANNKNFSISISHTTRKPRPNEVNKQDYYFVNNEEFNLLIKNNSFFEYAKIFDNYYGTLNQQLKKNKNLSLVTFFILPPNIKTLKNRLYNRHKGQEKLIEQRMNKFNEEVSHWIEYNYVVINDDLETCYNKILNIIISEKEGISQKINSTEVEKKVEELTK